MPPRKRKPPTTWKIEADLCAAMIKALRSLGWRCYPEHAGWDFVAVDPHHGLRHGFQAKLQANLKVLEQASRPELLPQRTVNVVVVLVPRAAPEFHSVAQRLQLEALEADDFRGNRDVLNPAARLDRSCRTKRYLSAHVSETPITTPLPPESDLPCGVPSPKPITPWKLAAVTFCMDRIAAAQDTSALGQFSALFGIAAFRAALGGAKHHHPDTWVQKGWARLMSPNSSPKQRLWALTDAHDLPSKQYPEIVELITRDRLQKAAENQPK